MDITPCFRTLMSGGFWTRQSWNLAFGPPFPVTENDIVHCVLILQGLCSGGFVRPCHTGGSDPEGYVRGYIRQSDGGEGPAVALRPSHFAPPNPHERLMPVIIRSAVSQVSRPSLWADRSSKHREKLQTNPKNELGLYVAYFDRGNDFGSQFLLEDTTVLKDWTLVQALQAAVTPSTVF